MRRSRTRSSTCRFTQGVLIKTISITLLAGILAGIGPALIETRRLQLDPLRGIATSDRVRQRWSHALVVLEITLTLALLVVTSSMVGGYQRSRGARDRLRPGPVHDRIGPERQLGSRPRSSSRPSLECQASRRSRRDIDPDERRWAPSSRERRRNRHECDPGGTDLDRSRLLHHAWRADARLAARSPVWTRRRSARSIVSESFARQVFGELVADRPSGVDGQGRVRHRRCRRGLHRAIRSRVAWPTPKIFLPLPAEPKDMHVACDSSIRATGDPAPLVEPVRRALRNAAVGINVNSVVTLRQMMTIVGQEYLAGTAPLFPLIVIGMMLTSSGIYGVLAFAISRRSRELAIRVAIGAARGNQIRLVMAHSLRLVLIGSTCGIALTFGLSRLVRAAGGAGSLYDPPWPAFVVPVCSSS